MKNIAVSLDEKSGNASPCKMKKVHLVHTYFNRLLIFFIKRINMILSILRSYINMIKIDKTLKLYGFVNILLIIKKKRLLY